MEIVVIRKVKDDVSTIGDMSLDGAYFCHTLEDKDRGLVQTMPLSDIEKIKKPCETAIPTGQYEVTITWSDRFKRLMPLIMNVPGYAGARIHWGNYSKDTDGCILVGKTEEKDFIGSSVDEFNMFFNRLTAALKVGKVFITIQ